MEVTAFLVDWNEVVKRHKDGRLEEYMVAAGDKEDWIKELSLYSMSNNHYCAVAEAWESIRGAKNIPQPKAAKAKEFMNRLITLQNYLMDLRGAADLFSLTISPTTAAKLTKAAAGLDFAVYKDTYYAKCPEDTKEELAEYGNGKPERSFEKGFLPYVKSWVDLMASAAKKEKGILVAMD